MSAPFAEGLTPEQHAIRRTGVTGSEVAAILGLNPWQTRTDVYLDKVGKGVPLQQTQQMEWGLRLEEAIALKYAHEHGAVLWCPGTVRGPEDWMIGTPDFLAVDAADGESPGILTPHPETVPGCRLIECKNVNAFARKRRPGRATAEGDEAYAQDAGWGDPGTDQVPVYYLCQVRWYMACLGIEVCYLAALFGGNEWACYEIRRDADTEHMLVEAMRAFWFGHVVPRVPPPLDWSGSYQDYVAREFPGTDEAQVADAADRALAAEIGALRARCRALKQDEAVLMNRLAERMGSLARLEDDDWHATFGPVRGKINWQSAFRAHGGTDADAEPHRYPTRRGLRVYPPKVHSSNPETPTGSNGGLTS